MADAGKRPSGQGWGGPGGGGPAKRPSRPADDDDIMDVDDMLDDMDDGMQQPPEEGAEIDLGEAGRNWMRPPVKEFDPKTTSLSERRACAWGPLLCRRSRRRRGRGRACGDAGCHASAVERGVLRATCGV